MNKILLAALPASVLLVACATTTPAPAGLEAGKFVNFDCSGQDFSARFDPDGNTVRVRSHSGAAELSAQPDGNYSGDGFVFTTKGPDGISLSHAGKALGKNCKRA